MAHTKTTSFTFIFWFDRQGVLVIHTSIDTLPDPVKDRSSIPGLEDSQEISLLLSGLKRLPNFEFRMSWFPSQKPTIIWVVRKYIYMDQMAVIVNWKRKSINLTMLEKLWWLEPRQRQWRHDACIKAAGPPSKPSLSTDWVSSLWVRSALLDDGPVFQKMLAPRC